MTGNLLYVDDDRADAVQAALQARGYDVDYCAAVKHVPPSNMLGDSPAMQRMYALLRRIEDTETTVLITGESGTGKELVARTLHARGPNASGPLVAINCAAVPEGVLESELFGHVRGAFTDAKTARPGLFLRARGGTLFLDEIGEMPRSLQAKLLRAVQERTVRPVGGDREIEFDARILAATSRDLEKEVAEQRFREDLYYRINVIRVDVPPLRERGSDVLRIAEYYVEHFAARMTKQVSGIARSAAERLLAYSWPGNVRELQNCIERAVALSESNRLTLDDLPDKIRESGARKLVLPAQAPGALGALLTIAEVERHHILQVLQAVCGSRTQAAEVLGLDRRTLYRKLKLYART